MTLRKCFATGCCPRSAPARSPFTCHLHPSPLRLHDSLTVRCQNPRPRNVDQDDNRIRRGSQSPPTGFATFPQWMDSMRPVITFKPGGFSLWRGLFVSTLASPQLFPLHTPRVCEIMNRGRLARRRYVLALLCLLITSCQHPVSSMNCTADLTPGIRVLVRDAATGAPAAFGVRGVALD